MKKIACSIIFVLSISSCQDMYSFWPIEHFNLEENGLKDNEPVTVLYYNCGPYDFQVDQGFYRHAVVISSETNDTVNVLTFPNADLDSLTSKNNILIYNDHPILRKTIENYDKLSEEMKGLIESNDTTKLFWTEYSLVVRNPDFDFIANNNFKTVIGSLTK